MHLKFQMKNEAQTKSLALKDQNQLNNNLISSINCSCLVNYSTSPQTSRTKSRTSAEAFTGVNSVSTFVRSEKFKS